MLLGIWFICCSKTVDCSIHFLFSGEARDILLRQSKLAQFWQDFAAKALVLVNPTELEIFWQDFVAKVLVLVNPTEVEIFWQDFAAKALVLVNPTVVEYFDKILLQKP